MSEFYIGYLPKAPPSVSRFVKCAVMLIALLAAAVALVLVLAQSPFAHSAFEFGRLTTLEGYVTARPYPALLVTRPGATGGAESDSRYLLVAPGKHGAEGLADALDGKLVRLRGQLIYRDGATMVEVRPGEITVMVPASPMQPPAMAAARNLGPARLTGEIVDSKCYLGVMNPGQGKVHRDCATRCLSGGIPPIFIVAGSGDQFVLTDPEGNAIAADGLREFVSEPITVYGRVFQRGDSRELRMDPRTLRHP